jgi:hypothetical protein
MVPPGPALAVIVSSDAATKLAAIVWFELTWLNV